MSHRLYSIFAGLLLASFVAGGALAPTLHRVHHAQEQHQMYEAASPCAHGPLADRSLAEEGGPLSTMEACPILARYDVMGMVLAAAGQTAVLRHEATRSAVVLALHGASVEGRIVIRGPPGRP